MIKVYYKMMVSSVYTSRKSAVLNDIWKFTCIFYPSIAMASNVILVLLIINNNFDDSILKKLNVEYISKPEFNFFINLFLHLVLPLVITNYYLVLYKNKYKKLIESYPNSFNKKAITIYLILSILSLLVYLFSLVEIRW